MRFFRQFPLLAAFATLEGKFAGRYPSDHLPVMGRLALPR